MTLIYIEDDTRLEFREADFPLALGLRSSHEICLGKEGEAYSVAWLRYDFGQLSIQPEFGKRRIAINGAPLTGPTWLLDKTSIEIENVSLALTFENNRPILTIIRAVTAAIETIDLPINPDQALRFGQRIANESAARVSGARNIKRAAIGVFATLAAVAAYVVVASPVTIDLAPQEAEVHMTGPLPVIPFGDRYLALPGHYQVSAEAPGYRPAAQDVIVHYGALAEVKLALEKLPGRLTIITTPDVPSQAFIDGQSAGTTPLRAYEVSAGVRELRIRG